MFAGPEKPGEERTPVCSMASFQRPGLAVSQALDVGRPGCWVNMIETTSGFEMVCRLAEMFTFSFVWEAQKGS